MSNSAFLFVPIFHWGAAPSGLLYTYAAGSTTPKVTYSDAAGTIPNTNPVILDTTGSATVRLGTGSYNLVLKDQTNTITYWSEDNYDQPLFSSCVTQALIGATLYPVSTLETAAGVLPVTLIYPELDPRRYGVDVTGATDSSAAVSVWLSVGAAYNVILKNYHGGSIRCDSGFIIDSNTTGLDINGGIFDFSNMTTGHAIAFTQSNSNVNIRPLLNSSHPISNGTLLGPGVGITAVDCIYMNDAISSTLPGLSFKNLSIRDFTVDMTYGLGAYCVMVENCLFTQITGSADTTYSIQVTSTNNGERNVFTRCWWYNKAYGINQQSGNSDFYFDHCSADVFTRFFNALAGTIVADTMHLESGGDTDYWGVRAAGANLILNHPTIVIHANKSAFDMFQDQSGDSNFGIFIDTPVLLLASFTMTTRIIGGTSNAVSGGTGNGYVKSPIQGAASARPTLTAAMNKLAYGDMENANWAGDWTLSGTTIPTQSTAQSHSATHSMLLSGTSSNNPAAVMKRSCSAGQYLQGEFWYLLSALTGTGGSFNVSVSYQDAAGVQITGNTVLGITTTVATFTKSGFSAINPAPAGTATVALTISVTGVTTGAPLCYIDDLIANIA